MFAAIPACFAQTEEPSVMERCRIHYEKGEYNKALELIVVAYQQGPVEFTYFGEMWSTEEFIERLCIRTGQLKKGIEFFNKIYNKKLKAIEEGKKENHLEEALLDLALRAGNTDLAREVVDRQALKRFDPGVNFNYARIYAVEGNGSMAVEALRSYIESDFGGSFRTQVLTRYEFKELYSNNDFRELMKETRADLNARYEALMNSDDETGKTNTMDFTAFRKIADNYKSFNPSDNSKEQNDKLSGYDRLLRPYASRFRQEIFSLIKEDKNNTIYRLSLSVLLAGLYDPVLSRELSAELSGDNLLVYPRKYFELLRNLSTADPAVIMPDLLQLIGMYNRDETLMHRFRNLNGDDMQMAPFSFAETYISDTLLSIAASDDTVKNRNAAAVLLSFQHPELLSVLSDRINKETDPTKRRLWLFFLSRLCMPEAAALLEGLRIKTRDKEEAAFIASLPEAVMQKNDDMYKDNEGLAITDPEMKRIFFSNLVLTGGTDISFVRKTLLLSSTPEDINELKNIRSSISRRTSGENSQEIRIVNDIIARLR